MSERAKTVAIVSVARLRGTRTQPDQDLVAVEAPVAVEVRQPGRPGGARRSLGVLMRTPGDDEELVLGLLHGEGLVRTRGDVVAIRHARPEPGPAAGRSPVEAIEVDVADGVNLDALGERALAPTSACGLCGRLEMYALPAPAGTDSATVSRDVVAGLPEALRRRQPVFAETGGLHAAALFDERGDCLAIREDVGRHNAVDKVIGWALAAGRLPARRAVLTVSGRVAFEIVQKAVLAGIPILVAVGAPSSLAVDAARAARLTLVGFARDGGCNVYTVPERLR